MSALARIEPEHRFVERIGEVGVELTAENEEGIFSAAADAFAELMLDGGGGGGEVVERRIELHDRDRALLLVDWLNELLFLAAVTHFVPRRVTAIELDVGEGHLHAMVAGREEAARPLVKGVALRGLRFDRERGLWHGCVVFDV